MNLACFYFRISWILMEQRCFNFFHPLVFVQSLRSLKHWLLQKSILLIQFFDVINNPHFSSVPNLNCRIKNLQLFFSFSNFQNEWSCWIGWPSNLKTNFQILIVLTHHVNLSKPQFTDYGHPMIYFFQISQIFWLIGQMGQISSMAF